MSDIRSQIVEKLNTVNSELDNLRSVSKQIHTARNETKNVLEITQIALKNLKQYEESYNQVISQYKTYINAKDGLIEKIGKINFPVLLDGLNKDINDYNAKVTSSIKTNNEKLEAFGEKINTLTKEIAEQKKNLTSQVQELNVKTAKVEKSIIAQNDSVEKLKENIEIFVDSINELKLKDRLDKLDGSVSGIVATIQTINSRLDLVEINIKESINSKTNEMKNELINLNNDQFQYINKQLLKSNNEIKSFKIINIVLLILLIIVGGVTLLKSFDLI